MEEFKDINLTNQGNVIPEKNGKVALIDADTIIYGACVTCGYETYLSDDEVNEDTPKLPGFEVNEDGTAILHEIDLPEAFAYSMDKVHQIMEETGCVDFELHFTNGRKSFRYTAVDSSYKANRLTGPTVYGLLDLKKYCAEQLPDRAFIHEAFEADDAVIAKKRANFEEYILCAVDKDVLYTLPGQHFNYYSSIQYNIQMKFIEVEQLDAIKHHYLQCLTGDSSDGIIGLKGVGKKTAEKILASCTTDQECWTEVIKAYESKGRNVVDAIKNMRLVNMHQITYDGANYNLNLWRPL